MKKIILFMAMLAIFASCSQESLEEDHCYKVNYIMHTDHGDVYMEEYKWMDANSAKWQEKRYKEVGYTGISIKRDYSYNNFEDCWMRDTTTHLCGKYTNF